MPHPRWIESKPSLGTIAESHSAELVGVLVDEIATYAEQARDRRGVDQFSAGLLLFEYVGDSSSHSLYLRIT